MRPKATGKVLRAVSVAAVLVLTLVSGALVKSRPVGAKSCEDAFTDYINANFTYETARISYFYGEPTSCASQCQLVQDPQQCISDCQTSRYTALAQADMALFSTALDTCTPSEINQCAQAQTMANNCLSQYNSALYADPEEAGAVADQFWACWEASKIDSCR